MSKILIYGGAKGTGSSAAHLLHQQGKSLHLVGRDEAATRQLAQKTNATYSIGDVTDPHLFNQVIDDANDSLSGLIYAVGTLELLPLSRLTAEKVRYDFEVNALGAAQAIQAALPALKACAEQSSVVLFSSIAASRGFPFHSSISMAKGAIEGLTVALAAELAPQIRINTIAPSLTQSPLALPLTSNEKLAQTIAAQHPLKRLGTTDDAANIAAFLLSDQSSWITGQIIHLDGGRSAVSSAS